MKHRFALNIALSIPLLGMPIYAQHGHGGGGGASEGMGHNTDHASTANSGANSTRGSGSKGSSVSERLQDNTKLSSKLQGLLPSGTNVQQAAQGFKNLGQFVAAVHVSHNLGIPFDQLKTKMVGPPSESLGKAIHALKPDVKSSDETKKAERQAKQDIDDSRVS
jgi:hypothetical protein